MQELTPFLRTGLSLTPGGHRRHSGRQACLAHALTKLISALWRACCTGPGTLSNKSAHNSSNSPRVTFALKSTSSIKPSICGKRNLFRGSDQILLSGPEQKELKKEDSPPLWTGATSLPSHQAPMWAPVPCDQHWHSGPFSDDWLPEAVWPWHVGFPEHPWLSGPCAAH